MVKNLAFSHQLAIFYYKNCQKQIGNQMLFIFVKVIHKQEGEFLWK